MEKNKIKILVIDDLQINLIGLKYLIEEAFPNALTLMALNGAEGLKIAASEDPDVILLDIIMPIMDGFEVCNKLKEDKKLSDIPVVFITANKEDKESHIRALEAGAEAFLAKPINENELTALIRTMVKIKNVNVYKRNEQDRLAELVEEKTEELKVANQISLDLLEDLKKENEARKKNEEALGESEERYRELANSITDVFFAMDSELRVTYWNRATEKLTGISPKSAIGKHIYFLFPVTPKLRREIAALRMVLKSKQPRSFTTHLLYNEKIIVLEISVYPSKDGISVFARDITKRKKVEEALRKSKENCSDVFQTVNEGIVYATLAGEIISVNSSLEQILEISKEEVIGKNILTLSKERISSKNINNILPVITELIQGKKNNPVQVKYKNKILEVYTNINLKSEHLTGVIRDITERKRAEIILIESEERYKRITTGLTDYLYTVKVKDGKIVETIHNEACLAITGYSSKNFAEDPYLWINMVVPEEREWIASNFMKILEGKDLPPLEHRIIRKDGKIRWISDTAIPKYDSNGVLVSYDGVIKDITDRKRAEEEIKKAHDLLEQLYIHQEEIRENERRAISREIHDELGQSLTALKMDLGWTKDNVRYNAEVKKKIEDMIDIIGETIEKVQKISSDLRPGLLDDFGLVPAMEWYIQEFEKRAGIKCYFKTEDIQPINEKKNLALYRILQESLTNVSRHANAKNVNINLSQVDDSIVLEIIDDGIGIEQEKIYSYKSLGLIGIRERVKQFNGNLDITSTRNKQTKIRIIIPSNEILFLQTFNKANEHSIIEFNKIMH